MKVMGITYGSTDDSFYDYTNANHVKQVATSLNVHHHKPA